MLRALTILTLVAAVGGSAFTAHAYLRRPTVTSGSWHAWSELTPTERQGWIERYKERSAGGDIMPALAQARVFAALPATEQDHLREVAKVIAETLAAMPAARRRELLLMPPSSRAWHLFQQLADTRPELLTTLHPAPAQP